MSQETKVVVGIMGICLLVFAGIIFHANRQEKKRMDNGAVPDQSVLVREDSWKIEAPGSRATLVEFLDFECEACRAAYPAVKRILSEYEGRIAFVVRNFPLHKNSVLAAKSAEAAGEQGKFWEMYAKLFENQQEWGEKQDPQTELFRKYAREIGLDIVAFDAVVGSAKYEDKIARDKNDGMLVGVQGTPTFYLNGRIVRGVPSYADLKQLIDNEHDR